MRIVDGNLAAEIEYSLLHAELHASFVGISLFGFQRIVAARLEIKVVQRRIAVIASDGSLEHDAEPGPQRIIDEPGRNQRRQVPSVTLAAQVDTQPQTRMRPVLHRSEQRHFGPYLVIAEPDRILGLRPAQIGVVQAAHRMDIDRRIGRQRPLRRRIILGIELPVAGVDPAVRVDHLLQLAAVGIGIPVVTIQDVGIDIAGLGAHFQPVAATVPRGDRTQRRLVLRRAGLSLLLVVHRQHRDAAPRIGDPGRQPEAIPLIGLIVKLLQQVKIAVRAVLVPLHRIDPLPVDLLVLIVIAILEIVVGGHVAYAGRGLELPGAVGETQELVVSVETADTLNEVHAGSRFAQRFGPQRDRPPQTAPGHPDRTGSVIEARLVDEIGRDQREVDHAEHG